MRLLGILYAQRNPRPEMVDDFMRATVEELDRRDGMDAKLAHLAEVIRDLTAAPEAAAAEIRKDVRPTIGQRLDRVIAFWGRPIPEPMRHLPHAALTGMLVAVMIIAILFFLSMLSVIRNHAQRTVITNSQQNWQDAAVSIGLPPDLGGQQAIFINSGRFLARSSPSPKKEHEARTSVLARACALDAVAPCLSL